MEATLRYAQCWEDADVLCTALAPAKDHRVLAIAGAGDNALALLALAPRSVHAIDYNPVQIAALALRVAALRALNDEEFLQLLGATGCGDRAALYARCRGALAPQSRAFWDSRGDAIERGIGGAGRFERYFTTFRSYVLPLVHDRATVASLLAPKSRDERLHFFETIWENRRWRTAFALFFSRPVMSRIGRDPSYFDHATDNIERLLLPRVRHALVEQDPSRNPYLHWILTGSYGDALPRYLRPAQLSAIREHLDRLTWECTTLEAWSSRDDEPVDRLALSDVFEYMSEEEYVRSLHAILRRSARNARLSYWNMLVPRSRPASLADRLVPAPIAATLHEEDRAFFYRAFVVEDVR